MTPLPKQKFFFDFHFQRCIRVYSICAVKIRTPPSRIVRETANMYVFQGIYVCAHSMRNAIKSVLIHNGKRLKRQFFQSFDVLITEKHFSPFSSKRLDRSSGRFFYEELILIGVLFFFFEMLSE